MNSKRYTVIIGEETGTKVKGFLFAPGFTPVAIGDIVVAHGLKFRALYVDECCSEDGVEMTILRVALGQPYQVKSIIKEKPVKWEDDNDDVDG